MFQLNHQLINKIPTYMHCKIFTDLGNNKANKSSTHISCTFSYISIGKREKDNTIIVPIEF